MVIITTIRRLLGHNFASSDTNNNPEATIEISAALQDAIQKAIVRRRCLDAIVARQRGIASTPTTHPIASISQSDSAPSSTNTDSSDTRNDPGTLGMTSSSGSPILRSPPNQSHGSPPPNVPVLTSLRDLRASEKNLNVGSSPSCAIQHACSFPCILVVATSLGKRREGSPNDHHVRYRVRYN